MKVYENLRTRESAALNFRKLCRALSELKRAENAKRVERQGDRKRKPLRSAVRSHGREVAEHPCPQNSRDRTAGNIAVSDKRDRNKGGTRSAFCAGQCAELVRSLFGVCCPPRPLVFNRFL